MISLSSVRGFALALIVSILAGHAGAQCLDWRAFPASEPGVTQGAYALAVHDDGTGSALYVAGEMAGGSIRRWNGVEFQEVGTGLSGQITSLVSFDDGNGPALYAGGTVVVPGIPGTSWLARWDGASWQTVGGTPNNTVYGLVVHDDGTGAALYAYGAFSSIGGVAAGAIAKWNGTTWAAVGPVPGYVVGDRVIRAASFDDGTGPALVAFADITGSFWFTARHYGRWRNGAWSAIPSAPDGTPYGMVSYDDGSGPALYVCGNLYGPSPYSGVRRFDGTSWQSVADTQPAVFSAAAVLDLGAGPRAYFGRTGDNQAPSVRVWDSTGWSTLAATQDATCTYVPISALAAYDEGAGPRLFAATYAGVLGAVNSGLSRWNGTAWEVVGAEQQGINGELRALHVHDDGSGPALYVGGSFCGAGPVPSRGVARWEGTQWNALDNTNLGTVRALTSWTSGGTSYLMSAGTAAFARWDGNAWTVLANAGFQGSQFGALATFGSDVWLGGAFPAIGVPSTNLVRWNGASFQSIGAGANGAVDALTVVNLGGGPALYVGGSFTNISGFGANRIARWNGTMWDAVGGGMNGVVDAFTSFDDGSGLALYAGGLFSTAGGVAATNVARWNGTSWSALGTGLAGQVLSLGVYDDGSGPALYAGGTFNSLPGGVCHAARWNGTSWSPLGDGPDGAVWAMRAHDDGTGDGPLLFVGGAFEHVGARPSRAFAAWRGCAGEVARFCFGDGTTTACPCGNQGLLNRGCQNSASTGGARFSASGSIALDTVELRVAGELPNAATLVFQGDSLLGNPLPFGDGLRCVGGNVLRMYTTSAVSGTVTVPGPGQPSIRARSAAQGDALTPGSIRAYQAWYRDANATFCGAPTGGAWNLSNAVRIVW